MSRKSGSNEPTLDAQALEAAYRSMKTIREFEERINVEVNNGRLAGFYHLCSGQEANAVAVCMQLSGDDSIVSTHRGHGHSIAFGADVEAMMKELWGAADGLCAGKGGTMHIADVTAGNLGANGIVGSGPPLSVGAALANQMKGNGAVSVSFSGDGSVNQGSVLEAMNLGVVLKVPAVFVIEDNFYGEFTGRDYQTGADLKTRTEAFGIPVWQADGTDFFAAHAAAADAVDHARSGKGPAALILEAGRFHGHFTGDPEGYRRPGEVAALRADKDPLKIFSATVTASGALTEDALSAVDAEVAELIDGAVAAAMAAPRPTAGQVLDDVYVSY